MLRARSITTSIRLKGWDAGVSKTGLVDRLQRLFSLQAHMHAGRILTHLPFHKGAPCTGNLKNWERSKLWNPTAWKSEGPHSPCHILMEGQRSHQDGWPMGLIKMTALLIPFQVDGGLQPRVQGCRLGLDQLGPTRQCSG